ncbi:hypothetical protein B0T24DRAFT_638565 [Lasiosphaeria ovina]|uniref:Uncharacterized protein n=1 Tax=Lasiosphaeria ovina TaxID=92902 RepID=A0AAE0N0B5_9PEZI|nr:hypothetical protein B0T24DRAFT_638565 [Lasiosphaeria ovina]
MGLRISRAQETAEDYASNDEDEEEDEQDEEENNDDKESGDEDEEEEDEVMTDMVNPVGIDLQISDNFSVQDLEAFRAFICDTLTGTAVAVMARNQSTLPTFSRAKKPVPSPPRCSSRMWSVRRFLASLPFSQGLKTTACPSSGLLHSWVTTRTCQLPFAQRTPHWLPPSSLVEVVSASSRTWSTTSPWLTFVPTDTDVKTVAVQPLRGRT